MSKLRSPEQKSKKMLNEEKMIIGLELAIKKEQFRYAQKMKQGFYETAMDDKYSQLEPVYVHKTNPKINHILNYLLNKIGF
jgi:hypothetical protein